MRVARLMVATAMLVATLSAGVARAEDGPVVRDRGGGFIEGSQTEAEHGDTRHGSEGGRPRNTNSRSSDESGEKDPEPVRDPNCDLGPGAPIPTPRNCPLQPLQPDTEPEPDELDDATAEAYARQLVVRLQLPDPTPQFGPDPSVNDWNMAAVGYPLWLWTNGPQTVTSTETAYGYTFTLEATYRSTTFNMGDGHTTTCTATTPYRASVKPGTPSPTCGYTYPRPAPGDGEYTVTATTHWDIDWSVAGYSGTLPGSHTANRTLPVGELQAIVVK